MKNPNLSLVFVSVACLITMICTPNAALAGPGWDFKASHGLRQCEFEASQSAPAAVNLKIEQVSTGSITITAEAGKEVALDLYCARAQTFDNGGQLASLGPELSYSSDTLGSGTVIGVEKPEDYVGTGRRRPKGRRWSVSTGNAPASYVLHGGSDTLYVTVQPVAGPPSQAGLDRAQQTADEAVSKSNYDYQRRVFQMTAGYVLHLDSLGKDADARGQSPSASMGWSLDVNALLGGKGDWKVLTGVTFDMMFRQKFIAYAPGIPDNGFNRWVDWSTYFIGPKIGLDWMPVEAFQLQLWGSLGGLISVDGTIPESQLPDMRLYTGESYTKGALGYKAGLNLNGIIAKHLVLGGMIGLEGNATQLPTERGPDKGDSGLILREGHFINALGQLTAGGQF